MPSCASDLAGVGAAAGAACEAVEGWGAAFACPGCALSMSAATMRPCGPEPWSAERSIPFRSAMRRASGLANTREAPVALAGAWGWAWA